MEELVKYIAGELAGADSVEVETVDGPDGEKIVNVYVDKAEIGKVIGKQGRIAKAIRTIVKAAAIKNNVRCGVEIIERQ